MARRLGLTMNHLARSDEPPMFEAVDHLLWSSKRPLQTSRCVACDSHLDLFEPYREPTSEERECFPFLTAHAVRVASAKCPACHRVALAIEPGPGGGVDPA